MATQFVLSALLSFLLSLDRHNRKTTYVAFWFLLGTVEPIQLVELRKMSSERYD